MCLCDNKSTRSKKLINILRGSERSSMGWRDAFFYDEYSVFPQKQKPNKNGLSERAGGEPKSGR